MEAPSNGPVSVLLLGLIALAALIEWRRRRRGGAPREWWRPIAGASAATAVLSALTLTLFGVWMRGGLYRWCPSTPIDELGSNYSTGQCIRFVIAYAGMLGALPWWWRGNRGPVAPRGVAAVFLTRVALFVCFTGALFSRWILLDGLWGLAPFILQPLTGAWLGPPDLLRAWPSPREVVVEGMELFSQVTLLIWLFQCLWGLTEKDQPFSRHEALS